MATKPILHRLLYFARDTVWRSLFPVLRENVRGQVLDVGGWDFFTTAVEKGVTFEMWTNLEPDPDRPLPIEDPRYKLVCGDGCAMPFDDESFDTVLNIQVLEHVLEPLAMVSECARVLKPGGRVVFLIPQTGVLHLEPHHYYNFTPFWIRQAMERYGLCIERHDPLGGVWKTEASHLFYFLYGLIRRRLRSPIGIKRPVAFYLLLPFMSLYTLLNIPICLFFGLADLPEEANNHLVVARKL